MPPPEDATDRAPRRWGGDRALLDDDEARRRLLDATGTCIVRRGNAQIRMAEVADEAGVARSTVYRYFRTRDDLVLGLLLSRVDAALETVVRSLRNPDDAATCLPEIILKPIGLVEGNPLNEALFSERSSAFVTSLELSSEPLLDASPCATSDLCSSDGATSGDSMPTSMCARPSAGSTPCPSSSCRRHGALVHRVQTAVP